MAGRCRSSAVTTVSSTTRPAAAGTCSAKRSTAPWAVPPWSRSCTSTPSGSPGARSCRTRASSPDHGTPGSRQGLRRASPHPRWGRVQAMKPVYRTQILNRLKTARGHLDAVVRMVEDEAYCPDVMKQLSAVQGSLERASRLVLRNHLETCVAAAMQAGRVDEIVDELMEALRFDRTTTGPGPEGVLTVGTDVAPS